MTDPINASAEDIIAAFGGIRPMAKKLGVAVTTIQGWKARGTIPLARMAEVRAAAEREGIDLSAPSSPEMVEEVDAEPVRRKPDAGVRAAGGGVPPPPPVIDQPAGPSGNPNRQGQLLILAGCIVGAALVGAVLTYVWVGAPPEGGNAATAGRIEKLETRVAAAERAARAATAKAAAADGSARELARLARALGKLEVQTATLSRQVKSAGDGRALQAALARVDAAEKALAKLAVEVKSAAQKAAATAAASGDPKAIARLVTQTEALQKALAAQTASLKAETAKIEKATGKALDDLKGRMARLETQVRVLAETAGRTSSLVLALGQLRQAASSGRPFRAALDSAAGLAAREAEVRTTLQRLEKFADAGVPTLHVLRERFDPLTARMVRAAAVAGEGDWLDRMWARINSLVVVRRTGRGVTGDSLPALVARTENALKDGKLAAAVALVGRMPPAAQSQAASWLKDARARLAVDGALAELARHAARLVAGRGKQAPGAAE